MKRVAFMLADSNFEWMAGVDHLRNLLRAIVNLPQCRIEPVLLVAPAMPAALLADFPQIEILRTALADAGSGWRRLRRLLPQQLLAHDRRMARFLIEHRIDVLSHADLPGGATTLPTIGWILDFQHRRVPQFFTSAEIAARNQACSRIASQSTVVLLGSHDASQDFARQCPQDVAKGRVLHAVACLDGIESRSDEEAELRRKHGLQQAYFHLPNPFWAHKNHRIVLEALAILKKEGRPALVVSSGDNEDLRQPEHYAGLIRYAEKIGVDDQFRVLGQVPHADEQVLMRHAVAVINPSLFEGWSTSVEEAKSLGSSVVLSDIAVHREQAPERGRFFDPDSAPALATTMASIADDHSAANELEQHRIARQRLPQRMREFGAAYQAVVLEIT